MFFISKWLEETCIHVALSTPPPAEKRREGACYSVAQVFHSEAPESGTHRGLTHGNSIYSFREACSAVPARWAKQTRACLPVLIAKWKARREGRREEGRGEEEGRKNEKNRKGKHQGKGKLPVWWVLTRKDESKQGRWAVTEARGGDGWDSEAEKELTRYEQGWGGLFLCLKE